MHAAIEMLCPQLQCPDHCDTRGPSSRYANSSCSITLTAQKDIPRLACSEDDRTDRQTDRQTDRSNACGAHFAGETPADAQTTVHCLRCQETNPPWTFWQKSTCHLVSQCLLPTPQPAVRHGQGCLDCICHVAPCCAMLRRGAPGI